MNVCTRRAKRYIVNGDDDDDVTLDDVRSLMYNQLLVSFSPKKRKATHRAKNNRNITTSRASQVSRLFCPNSHIMYTYMVSRSFSHNLYLCVTPNIFTLWVQSIIYFGSLVTRFVYHMRFFQPILVIYYVATLSLSDYRYSRRHIEIHS